MSGNNLKTIPIMIVTLVIGFIMVTAAVMPLAADYSEAKTFTNEGYYNIAYTESEELTVQWDPAAPGTLVINSESYTVPSGLPSGVSIVCADDWIIRYTANSVILFSSDYREATTSNGDKFQLTASGGTATVEFIGDSTTTYTKSYTFIYHISTTGDYVMKKSNDPVYLNGNSTVYAMGSSNAFSTTGIGVKIEGSIDSEFTGSIFRRQNVSVDTITPDYSEVRGYNDLYTLLKFNVILKDTTNDATASVTYDYFIVPAEVSANPDNPDTFKNLVRIIPLISIVALVAMAAGMLYLKGKE